MSQPNTSVQRVQGTGPTDRYTRLPDSLLAELTPREHQLVHLLLSYRWTDDAAIYPYVGTLADRLGCSKRTIQRTLARLAERGYIVVVARYRDDSEHGHHGQTSNVYAPGPMLLPLLPRSDVEDDAGAGQERQAPMTPPSPEKKHRNEKPQRDHRNGRYTPPTTDGDFLATRDHGGTDYYQTRRGTLPMRP